MMRVTGNAMTKPQKGAHCMLKEIATTFTVKPTYLSHHTRTGASSKENTVSAFVLFSDVMCAATCIITGIIRAVFSLYD
jgi:hypothetical protein